MFEFFIFAFVTAITPGPNNSLLMASGIKFGRKASIPHFLGIWLGFTFLFFVGGFLLTYVPAEIFNYLQYVGYAVITYIAYRVATTSLDTNAKGSTVEKPFTFIQACLFQWINPKGVVMAVSGLTAFNITNNQGALIYFLVLPFCVGIWLILGEQLQNSLKKNKTVARAAYVVLGISMIASLLLA
jgi:threonine/homoserine/homoserine lactone efflux protein